MIATQRYPRYLLRVLNSFDEIYALLSLAVERHFLLTYGGSFTENFYGLKRERVLRIKGGEAPRASIAVPNLMRETLKLRTRDIWNNLAVIVGIPYLKRKLDESYDFHAPQAIILGPSYNRDSLPADATLRQRILYYYKWFLRNIYPSINGAYYFALLAFNLAYLFDNTKYSTPFLYIIGTRIRRMGEADFRAIALASRPPPAAPAMPAKPGQSTSIFNPRTLGAAVIPRLLSSLRILLPTSIFALKFLEWWHASDFASQLSRRAAEGLELPPPLTSGLPRPAIKQANREEGSGLQPKKASTVLNTVALSASAPRAGVSPDTQAATTFGTKYTSGANGRSAPPISKDTHLPILTVPSPSSQTSSLCPICLNQIQTPTAAQTGYVFCYTCIFKWVDGSHERQAAWMEGGGGQEGWGDEEPDQNEDTDKNSETDRRSAAGGPSRVGKWESGKGRCAITGRRVLGGTEGLRRVMV